MRARVCLAFVPIFFCTCVPKGASPKPSATRNAETAALGSGRAIPATPGRNVPWIKVNTVGYPADWDKVIIFNRAPQGAQVINDDNVVVLPLDSRRFEHHGKDEASGDEIWQADISALPVGSYRIRDADSESARFIVANQALAPVLLAAQKMFYFQRSRVALEKPYATWKGEEFLRPGVPHIHGKVGWDIKDYPSKKKKWAPQAGWHDAGNFDMYVPSTAPSAQGLLLAYEAHPELFQDGDLTIPESNNDVPDILDEARWGIDWVLSMQEPTGGFRLRETTITQSETPEGPAHLDNSTRWIDRVGSASTAKGCALSALASRIYEPFDQKYAKLNRERALLAWEWLVAHPERVTVPPVGAAVHNEYLLWDDGKEVSSDRGARFIAAVEIWATFRDPRALEFIRASLSQPELAPSAFVIAGWTNLSRWGLERLALDTDTPEELRADAKTRLLKAAQIPWEQAQKDGYRCATKPSEYYWGSNSNLMEKAQLMLVAARLDSQRSQEFISAARDQLHWILGRNPNGHSMVTQMGHAPTAMYHLEWGPLSPRLPPGYLVGGPNHRNMKFLAPNAPAKALLWEAPADLRSGVKKGGLWHWNQTDLWDAGFVPEGQWTEGWWAVTEPDIYYNMNLVLALTHLLGKPRQPSLTGTANR